MSIVLGRKLISKAGNDVYTIAEIGQNHQGSVATAQQLIKEAKSVNVDCVKFQKSCLPEKFTKSALQRPYESLSSWGPTYGEHKAFLEFEDREYKKLQSECNAIGLDFTASAMDEVSLEFLDSLNVPFIKIGSGDANNLLLLEKAANLEKPLIISTGMQSMKSVERIVEIMRKTKKNNFALMHCVSAYPTESKDCNLQMIPILMQKFPDVVIGYSGHELGVDITLAAVLLGARIVERHFTLDKRWKGSDHMCSLEPKELQLLTAKIQAFKDENLLSKSLTKYETAELLGYSKEVQEALEFVYEKKVLPCEFACKQKLGKSIVAAVELKKGHKLQSSDLLIKVSEPNGVPAENFKEVLGSTLMRDIEQDAPLQKEDIEENNLNI